MNKSAYMTDKRFVVYAFHFCGNCDENDWQECYNLSIKFTTYESVHATLKYACAKVIDSVRGCITSHIQEEKDGCNQ